MHKKTIPRQRLFLYPLISTVIILLILPLSPFLLIRISNESMLPTLRDGQWVLALRGKIIPGDVAIFHNSDTRNLNVKRYIMDSTTPPKIRNGWLITPWGRWFLSEKQWEYVETSYEKIAPDTRTADASGDSPEHFFFVGDNQFRSYDSRDFGYVSSSRIIGRIIGVWPHDS